MKVKIKATRLNQNNRKKLRELITQNQDGKCLICGVEVVECGPEEWPDNKATLEHLVPKSEGGGNNIENIAVTCRRCNNEYNVKDNYKMEILKRSEAASMIASTKGKFFGAEFVKRSTKEKRVMNARTGVKKGVKGVGMAYNPSEKGLVGVWDTKKGDYRMIPIDNLSILRIRGKEYRVVND